MNLKLWTAIIEDIQAGRSLPTTYLWVAQQLREVATFMRGFKVGYVEWTFKYRDYDGMISRGSIKFNPDPRDERMDLGLCG